PLTEIHKIRSTAPTARKCGVSANLKIPSLSLRRSTGKRKDMNQNQLGHPATTAQPTTVYATVHDNGDPQPWPRQTAQDARSHAARASGPESGEVAQKPADVATALKRLERMFHHEMSDIRALVGVAVQVTLEH